MPRVTTDSDCIRHFAHNFPETTGNALFQIVELVNEAFEEGRRTKAQDLKGELQDVIRAEVSKYAKELADEKRDNHWIKKQIIELAKELQRNGSP